MEVEMIYGVRENEVIAVTDEEGRVLGAAKTVDKVMDVVKDHFCGVKIELKKVEHNKHYMTTEISVNITEDGDEPNQYEFTLTTIILY